MTCSRAAANGEWAAGCSVRNGRDFSFQGSFLRVKCRANLCGKKRAPGRDISWAERLRTMKDSHEGTKTRRHEEEKRLNSFVASCLRVNQNPGLSAYEL